MGAAPITRSSDEYTRADSPTSKWSRTTARETTIPAHPPSACTKRAAASTPRLGAAAQASAAAR
jgi:hypothetical protein